MRGRYWPLDKLYLYFGGVMSLKLEVARRLPYVSSLLRRYEDACVEIEMLRTRRDDAHRTTVNQELFEFISTADGRAARQAEPILQPWCHIMANSKNGMSIDANGDVTTCCYDSEIMNRFGNIHETGIRAVWDRFKDIVVSDLYELPGCRSCILSRQSHSPPAICRDRVFQERQWRSEITEWPERIILEPSALCNYACEGCPANWNAKNIADLEKLHTSLEECLPHLRFLGLGLYGEPLLNKRLPAFLARCRSASVDLTMQLLTNGTALTQRVAQALVAANVDIITVAIHAGPLTENMLKYSRQGANYELVLRNIQSLVAARDAAQTSRTIIEVRTVLFNWNDTDALMDRLRHDVRATGMNLQKDRQYWVLDVAGPDAPRSSKRFTSGSPAVEALRARGEFNDF